MPSTQFRRDPEGVADPAALKAGPRARHPRGAALRALTPIVRRLHLQEVPRLRREAARLAGEVEQLRERADYYRDAFYDECGRSEMFQDALLRAEDIQLGLTRDGQLLVAPAEVPRG